MSGFRGRAAPTGAGPEGRGSEGGEPDKAENALSLRASDIERTHGKGCDCVATLPVIALQLDGDVLREIQRELANSARPETLFSAIALARSKTPLLDRPWFDSLVSALVAFAAKPCPTRGGSLEEIATVGWRTHEIPGFDGATGRWPNEWDGVDWANWTRGRATSSMPSAELWARVSSVAAWSLDDLLDGQPSEEEGRYAGLWTPYRTVSDTMELAIGPDWSYEDRLWALGVIRARGGGPFSALDPVLDDLARRYRRDPIEVLALLRFLDRCDRGLVAADPVTRLVLLKYPASASDALERTLDMMDKLDVAVPVDEPIEDAAYELIEAADLPLVFFEPPPTPAEDGGPDPLSVVRRLLPGGDGTRGVPPIVFTPTKLDLELLPHIEAMPASTLVVLSGNAGDGKTAFLSRVLRDTYRAGTNEYDIELGAKRYRVVLDGSEDTETRTNDDLLLDALAPFGGTGPVSDPNRGTLIAINKGRLLRFLEAHRDDFPYLWEVVAATFLGLPRPPENPYLLVDLNERSVLAPSWDQSMYAGVVSRLVGWQKWESECGRCDAQDVCPVFYNVRLLRKEASQKQLWRVLAAVDLDDRVHITARHLITKLARTVVGDQRCPDVRAAVRDQRPFPANSLLYNAVFAQDGDGLGAEPAIMDRATAAYDPAERSSPRRDTQLALHIARGSLEDVLTSPLSDSEGYLRDEITAVATGSIEEAPIEPADEYRRRTLSLMRHLSRRIFMMSPEDRLAPAFPLSTMDEFLSILGDADLDSVTSSIAVVQRLNAALGVESGQLRDLLAPRDYSRGLQGRGLAALIPHERFSLVRSTVLGVDWVQPPFVEAWPRALTLVATDSAGHEVARLNIPLLLYEILARASQGFRPTTQIERGFMVRLRGFYRMLTEHNWNDPIAYALYDNGMLLAKARLEPASLYVGDL